MSRDSVSVALEFDKKFRRSLNDRNKSKHPQDEFRSPGKDYAGAMRAITEGTRAVERSRRRAKRNTRK